jgi:hypothetical protein
VRSPLDPSSLHDLLLTEVNLLNRAWIGCVSTHRDAASTACAFADTLPVSIETSILASCDCDGFDINYS